MATSAPAASGSNGSTGNDSFSGGDAGEAYADPAFDAGDGGAGADGGDEPAGAGVGGAQRGAAGAFRFGNREWPSQERAEREFLTTIGRLQAAQRRQQELEAMVEAYKSGRGGPAEDAAQGETGAQDAQEAAEEALLDIDSLDWQLISGAMRERGPEVGMYLLAKALVGGIQKGLEGRMSKALEPLNSLKTHVTASAATQRLWRGAQEAVDDAGALMFPELSDQSAATVVYDIWQQITEGLPPEVANSPRMVRSAVLEYRILAQNGQIPQGGAGNNHGADAESAYDPNRVAAGALEVARAGAQSSGVLPPGGRQTGVRGRQRRMSEEDAIKASLLSEGQERGALGFRR